MFRVMQFQILWTFFYSLMVLRSILSSTATYLSLSVKSDFKILIQLFHDSFFWGKYNEGVRNYIAALKNDM